MSKSLTAVDPLPEVPEVPDVPRMTHEHVIELIEKWRKLLLLSGHHIDVHFGTEVCSESKCCAEMACNSPYMSGHYLTIHPRFFEVGDDAERERKIVHELCHIITGDVRLMLHQLLVEEKFVTYREAKDANERLTDFVANVAYALVE